MADVRNSCEIKINFNPHYGRRKEGSEAYRITITNRLIRILSDVNSAEKKRREILFFYFMCHYGLCVIRMMTTTKAKAEAAKEM